MNTVFHRRHRGYRIFGKLFFILVRLFFEGGVYFSQRVCSCDRLLHCTCIQRSVRLVFEDYVHSRKDRVQFRMVNIKHRGGVQKGDGQTRNGVTGSLVNCKAMEERKWQPSRAAFARQVNKDGGYYVIAIASERLFCRCAPLARDNIFDATSTVWRETMPSLLH